MTGRALRFRIGCPTLNRWEYIGDSLLNRLPESDIFDITIYCQTKNIEKYREVLQPHVKIEGFDQPGLVKKRNHILKKLLYGGEPVDFVIMFDDDIENMIWMIYEETALKPEACIETFIETYQYSKQFGFKYFGYNDNASSPGMIFPARFHPLVLQNRIGASVSGYLPGAPWFDENFGIFEDLEYTFRNLYKFGGCLKDRRYKVRQRKMGTLPGGWSDFRDSEMIEEAKRKVIEKYGPMVAKIFKSRTDKNSPSIYAI